MEAQSLGTLPGDPACPLQSQAFSPHCHLSLSPPLSQPSTLLRVPTWTSRAAQPHSSAPSRALCTEPGMVTQGGVAQGDNAVFGRSGVDMPREHQEPASTIAHVAVPRNSEQRCLLAHAPSPWLQSPAGVRVAESRVCLGKCSLGPHPGRW